MKGLHVLVLQFSCSCGASVFFLLHFVVVQPGGEKEKLIVSTIGSIVRKVTRQVKMNAVILTMLSY
jgi:hypothetical protein